jgi:6-pyruvoyltetrahydropterin/6-carboxytetrahydropterin synthase
MYYLKKTLEVAGAHHLKLDYVSKCEHLHGHNWMITVFCKAEELNKNGMILDFSEIKERVNLLDHACINDFVDQPTAENIAKWLCDQIPFCYRVEVEESKNNLAVYEAE